MEIDRDRDRETNSHREKQEKGQGQRQRRCIHRKHLEDLDSGGSQPLLSAVKGDRNWCRPQVLSKKHNKQNTPGDKETGVCQLSHLKVKDIKPKEKSEQVSHSADRPQWDPALSPAVVNTDRPISETVGVIVRGPMYSSSKPGSPQRPIKSSTRLDTMMAPWIWDTLRHE